MPLPGAGTSTAFLSSVRPTHCSTSRASRSISSSDFSAYMNEERGFITTLKIQTTHGSQLQVLQQVVAIIQGRRLAVFVDDFLDLFIEVLPTFDQGFGPTLSNTVEVFLLETGRDQNQGQLAQ